MRVELTKAQYYAARSLIREHGIKESGAFGIEVSADEARELFAKAARLPAWNTRQFITRDRILEKLAKVWKSEPCAST